jgi:hypothetical protein
MPDNPFLYARGFAIAVPDSNNADSGNCTSAGPDLAAPLFEKLPDSNSPSGIDLPTDGRTIRMLVSNPCYAPYGLAPCDTSQGVHCHIRLKRDNIIAAKETPFCTPTIQECNEGFGDGFSFECPEGIDCTVLNQTGAVLNLGNLSSAGAIAFQKFMLNGKKSEKKFLSLTCYQTLS